jgi:lipoyl(octanoyl) transferase
MHWQWRDDREPADPWTNMAIDAELLEDLKCDRLDLPVVRVYRWDRVAVSFGRLQDEDRVAGAYPDVPLVRRPTGGLAVLHNGGLTISMATRTDWLPLTQGRGVLSSYRQIVAGLIEALQKTGISADLGTEQPARTVDKPVDCFLETARCDIADRRTGRKVVGCAQRRDHNIILQQMQIAPDIITDEPLFLDYLQNSWKKTLSIDEWIRVDSPCRL